MNHGVRVAWVEWFYDIHVMASNCVCMFFPKMMLFLDCVLEVSNDVFCLSFLIDCLYTIIACFLV